ncbi:hypothetical protein Dhaf_0676 [Desulfitobacterium hafniense DCB-2]|uniref:DUF3137 domain-containing protein n=1 Tax=Desulfitobacterium hafniense (strain DSM 10664 / DCB-2) TaxID=272564 RepID=B8FVV5_DESHD|nr:hypothetical protein [Desulfitobacterium hafniense]ACL18741.1 hypothetical protein Dhaf_0676 [Desulfitobacterium hafniense DCB-2]
MGLLREIFGPSQHEVWEALCQEIGADFIDGGFFKGTKVVAEIKEWVITLDTYTVSTGKTSTTYTRMRAPYLNKDGFKFRIYRKGIFSNIGKLLGLQDIEVGYPEFDDQFIIKGNDSDKLVSLFSNSRIRKLIEIQPDISLEVKDDEGWFGSEFPEGVDELYFQVPGIIKDMDRLKTLYFLFAEVLNQLCLIDSAYEDSPDVTAQL